MARKLITVDDITGAVAIMPTPAKPGSSDWRMTETVDYDEAARVVNALIESGVDSIMSMGTFGECATLTWPEKKKFMETIVDAAAGRIPIFVGTTALNTRDTVEQTRIAADIGANGTILGLPMWCAPSIPVAVQYYKDVAEGCPDMGICVYMNRQAFKFDFSTPFWAALGDVPQIVSTKHPTTDGMLRDQAVTKSRVRFLPIDMDYYGAARQDPDFFKAFWTGCAVCGPAPAILLRETVKEAVRTGDWTRAKQLSDEIAYSQIPLFPKGSFIEFSTYNIILEKEKMNAAGWMVAGPTRPPYHIAPPEYLEGAWEAGRRTKALHEKYAQQVAQMVAA